MADDDPTRAFKGGWLRPRARHITRNLMIAALILGTCTAAYPASPSLSPEAVQAAIKKGKNAVFRSLDYYNLGQDSGIAMIAVMALLNCGEQPNHPKIAKVINAVTANAKILTAKNYQGTYHAGVMLMMLGMINNPKKHKKLASRLCFTLKRFQTNNGGWGDFSRTQFALLGLKAAEKLGIQVHEDVFKRALKCIHAGQNLDGGWGYKPGRSSTGSMTAAGISGLYICGERLYRGTQTCGIGVSDKRTVMGLTWLSRNFTVRSNPRGESRHFYYLYALERIGVMLAQRKIGNHDWYREGAEYLIKTQRATGFWGRSVQDTEFALLFLGKGSQPIAIQKLRYGKDWNPDPYDVKQLVERASRDLGSGMTFQSIGIKSDASALAAAPILYLQGRKNFQFNEAFRQSVRAFVDQGGFIFASACCGATAFDQAFRQEIKLIFEDAAFQKIPKSHPIYSVRHNIEAPEAFMLEGVNTGCRTSIIYAPHDLCCAWGDCKGCKDDACVHGEESLKLGVNLIAYALNVQPLRDKLADVTISTTPDDTPHPRGTLMIGQLFHDGDWNPDPASIPNLTQTLRAEAGLKTKVAKKRVVLGRDELGNFPVLYLTGHKGFHYSEEQVKQLRQYLDHQGCLLSDPCCGRSEFDIAFKRLVKQLYPNKALTRLPAKHPIFQAPFAIKEVQYKPWARRYFPNLGNLPKLEVINHRDRITIIYSRLNFGCELQGHACPNCVGIKGKDAYRIAVNSIVYALSH